MMGRGASARDIVRLGMKDAGLAHLGVFRTLLRVLRVDTSCRHDPSWSRAKKTCTRMAQSVRRRSNNFLL
jgi:hypothetical protein